MNTLIVYSSKYGCTEKCARQIAEHLGGTVELKNLKTSKKDFDLNTYERVIIGSSIYVGKASKETTEFCRRNLDRLQTKKLGLYICCMRDGQIAEDELTAAYPEELRRQSLACDYFGGEIILNRLSSLDRLMARKAAKIETDLVSLSTEKIYGFSNKLKSAG